MDQNEIIKLHKRNQSLVRVIIFLILLLIVSGVILGYFYYKQKQKTEVITDEKNKLIKEFEELSQQFEGLKTDNDTLNIKLAQKQVEIQKYISEITRLKTTNAEIIRQYKVELNTLREIMRSYIVQIDSLNTRNQVLKAENKDVKEQIEQVKTDLQNEKTIKENLSQKVETGSKLTAKNLTAVGLNDKGRERNKASRIEDLKICFILRENAIAEAGKKIIYLRVKNPDGLVLADSEANTFNADGQKLVFSASREVKYENQDLDVCIFFKNNDRLRPGNHELEIYTGGYKLASTTLEIK